MRDIEQLRSELRAAHAEVMQLMQSVVRESGGGKANLKAEYDSLVRILRTEDNWFTFRRKAKNFIDLMLDRGDMEGRQVWSRIRRAIVQWPAAQTNPAH